MSEVGGRRDRLTDYIDYLMEECEDERLQHDHDIDIENTYSRYHNQIEHLCEDSLKTVDEDEGIIAYLLISVKDKESKALMPFLSTSIIVSLEKTENPKTYDTREPCLSSSVNNFDIRNCFGMTVRELCCVVSFRNLLQYASPEMKEVSLAYFLNATLDAKLETASEKSIDVDILFLSQCTNSSKPLRPLKKIVSLYPGINEIAYIGSLSLLCKGSISQGELAIKETEEFISIPRTSLESSSKTYTESVYLVKRSDTIAETNGARGGRPIHRQTGQLLMTREQVEKVLEIRKRWEGLSPRQRRDNVDEEDFYPFLTLNRDETAQCLGVCATWLKDAIRAQGMITWPGRPLRRSGAYLQSQKELLESSQARLYYTSKEHPDRETYENEVQKLAKSVRDTVVKRAKIVEENVKPKYFLKFISLGGEKFLNPTWNALPPTIISFD